MRGRTVLVLVALAGAGSAAYAAIGGRVGVRRFVATLRCASAEREDELRAALGVLEETDRATPYTEATGRDRGVVRSQRGRHAASDDRELDEDSARSLTPEEARALLLDPSGLTDQRAL